MTTIDLIREYVESVKEFVQTIRDEYHVENILIAKRQRLIPVKGTTRDGRFSFSFHGIGCDVQGVDTCVDFDFGEGGKIGGFDVSRLARFVATSTRSQWTEFTESRIRHDIEDLITKGTVIAPRLEPSPHLLYLVEDMRE